MIFIVDDPNPSAYVNAFIAVEGIAPIKIPSAIAVVDMYLGYVEDEYVVNDDVWIRECMDAIGFGNMFLDFPQEVVDYLVRIRISSSYQEI